MELTGHVTLKFNTKLTTAAVVVNIEVAFDMAWHFGLPRKLPKLELSTDIIKRVTLFPVATKIQSFDRRRNIYTMGNASKTVLMFHLILNILQLICK
jgi:hypothetical protein